MLNYIKWTFDARAKAAWSGAMFRMLMLGVTFFLGSIGFQAIARQGEFSVAGARSVAALDHVVCGAESDRSGRANNGSISCQERPGSYCSNRQETKKVVLNSPNAGFKGQISFMSISTASK